MFPMLSRPVWFLRVVVSWGFQTLYVSAVGVFLVSLNCHFLGQPDVKYTMVDFPDRSKWALHTAHFQLLLNCWQMQGILLII